METNSFKNWWDSKDHELRRDPIESAQQMIQRPDINHIAAYRKHVTTDRHLWQRACKTETAQRGAERAMTYAQTIQDLSTSIDNCVIRSFTTKA